MRHRHEQFTADLSFSHTCDKHFLGIGCMEFKPIKLMMESKIGPINKLGNYFAYIWQYRFIMKQLIKKDFKGRFSNTILGYFWHLLNPLSQIVIYYLIFTVIFGRDIPNYWAYVSTGMFMFTFFLSSSAGISNCLINNSSMITKMAMAREIIPISKVITNLITLSISYVLLTILMIVTGVGITINILWAPLLIILLALFSLGLGLLLSSITVYVRDVANAANILFGCMMFAVPIFYMASTRSTPMMELFWSVNPLYYFVETIHDILYWGVAPDLIMVGACLLSAFLMIVIGLFVFKKLEKGFAERM